MAGVCKLCDCTDDNPCIVDGQPCSWVLPNLCSACCVFIEPGHFIIPKECRHCNRIIEGKPLPAKSCYTCSMGRYDPPDISPGGHRWFAWSGIERPNRTVAAAQKKCPFFEIHVKWRRHDD